MNIFILYPQLGRSAKELPDKLLIKQILEIAQIICTIMHLELEETNKIPYKIAFKNHPVVKWSQNNKYLVSLYGMIVCREYTHRFNKIHKSEVIIQKFLNIQTFTPIKIVDFPIKNDIQYLKGKIKTWKHKAKWTNRNVPEWVGE